ncbi:MAG: hypothetical protein ACRETA_04435 [Gammaproteobacteria bacterium]
MNHDQQMAHIRALEVQLHALITALYVDYPRKASDFEVIENTARAAAIADGLAETCRQTSTDLENFLSEQE